MNRLRIFCLGALGVCLASSLSAEIRNFTHEDNLKSNFELGCIDARNLQSVHTPADIVKVVQACIQENRFEDAFQSFFIYTIYGGYDALRMKDETAKNAMSVMNLRIFHSMDETQRKGFQQEVIKMSDLEGTSYKSACSIARQLGKPDYYPKYMIAHGMKAFSEGTGDGLIPDFDPDQTWVHVLEHLNGCRES